ncbi:hypothetical protein ASC99_07490 [Kitasatospora sp. Root107]|nr:hypothetical protein ASC99_07490 [Kitasatospora sp. Root107]
MASEQALGGLLQHRSAAEREHSGVPGQGPVHRRALPDPEVRLALLLQDLPDTAPRRALDVAVGVPEPDPEVRGERPADVGLARTGWADQHDDRTAHLRSL